MFEISSSNLLQSQIFATQHDSMVLCCHPRLLKIHKWFNPILFEASEAGRKKSCICGGLLTLWGNEQLFMVCILPKDWLSSNMVAFPSYESGDVAYWFKKKKTGANTSDTDLKFYILTATTKYNPGQMPTCILFTSKCLEEFFHWRFNKVIRLKSTDNTGLDMKGSLHITFWLGEVGHNKFSNKPLSVWTCPKASWPWVIKRSPSRGRSNSSHLEEALHSKYSK